MNAIAFTREERAVARVSKDGVQLSACSHPSRRARKCAHFTGERTAFVPGMTSEMASPPQLAAFSFNGHFVSVLFPA
jgi:hypothetical protein